MISSITLKLAQANREFDSERNKYPSLAAIETLVILEAEEYPAR